MHQKRIRYSPRGYQPRLAVVIIRADTIVGCKSGAVQEHIARDNSWFRTLSPAIPRSVNMNELAGLWIPIIVSAFAVLGTSCVVRVFIAQCLQNEKTLPEEDVTIEHLQKSGTGPGFYVFPGTHRRSSNAAEESRQQRIESGPWGTMNIRARQPNIGRTLLQSLTFCLVTSVFIAYLGTLALNPGDGFLRVFQVTGTAGILAYAFGGVPNAIWFGLDVRSTLIDVAGGIVYGLITGIAFGILWPT